MATCRSCDVDVASNACVSCEKPPSQVSSGPVNVRELFERFSLDDSNKRAYQHFGNQPYTRNLVAFNKEFSLVLLCWEKGQGTPIHTHGANTQTWVRVLEGSLAHTSVDGPCGQDAIVDEKTMVPAGGIYVYPNGNERHRTSNNFDGKTVSLHLYSPPYLECSFNDTLGKRAHIPVVRCCVGRTSNMRCPSTERVSMLPTVPNNPCFMNFQQLVELLRREIVVKDVGTHHTPDHIAYIKGLLENTDLNPQEWARYARFTEGRYTRNLVGYDAKFTVLLLCWEKGMMSPIHDHAGSSCWVKVLEGELNEVCYATNLDGTCGAETSNRVCVPGQVAYINDTMGLHKMGNPRSDLRTISLHIYSPAYQTCRAFDPVNNTSRVVNMVCVNQSATAFLERPIESFMGESSGEGHCSQFNPSAACQTLDKFVTALRGEFSGAAEPSAERLEAIISSLDLKQCEWKQYVHFGEFQYTRNLLALDANFSVMLNCWNVRQGTPVHDHGTSASPRKVWIKALDGSLTVTRFGAPAMDDDDNLPVLSTSRLSAGEPVVRWCDRLGLHKVQNENTDRTAVTLHIYSPPYIECCYRTNTGKGYLPVVYCSSLSAPERIPASRLPLAADVQLCAQSTIFGSMDSFVDCMRLTFDNAQGNPTPSDICKLMRGLSVGEREWRQYMHEGCTKSFKTLVADCDMFSMYLVAWKPGQSSTIHNHGKASSYAKVLRGEVTEMEYAPNADGTALASTCEVRMCELRTDCVVYRGKDSIHRITNTGDAFAFTLHVYAPRLEGATTFDGTTGQICTQCA